MEKTRKYRFLAKFIKAFSPLLIIACFISGCYSSGQTSKKKIDQSDPLMKTGLTIVTPRKEKAVMNKGINIEILDAKTGQIITATEQEWNTIKDYRLLTGDYILKSYVRYMGGQIWKTSTDFSIVDKEKITVAFDYPFLTTSKAKATVY